MRSKPATADKPEPELRQKPPWLLEARAARNKALDEARPCILILNADSGAL